MNIRLENKFLILRDNKRIHIPTLELLLEGGTPLVEQKGKKNVIIIMIGSKQIKLPGLTKFLLKRIKSQIMNYTLNI